MGILPALGTRLTEPFSPFKRVRSHKPTPRASALRAPSDAGPHPAQPPCTSDYPFPGVPAHNTSLHPCHYAENTPGGVCLRIPYVQPRVTHVFLTFSCAQLLLRARPQAKGREFMTACCAQVHLVSWAHLGTSNYGRQGGTRVVLGPYQGGTRTVPGRYQGGTRAVLGDSRAVPRRHQGGTRAVVRSTWY